VPLPSAVRARARELARVHALDDDATWLNENDFDISNDVDTTTNRNDTVGICTDVLAIPPPVNKKKKKKKKKNQKQLT
jgi:hypothetical protein